MEALQLFIFVLRFDSESGHIEEPRVGDKLLGFHVSLPPPALDAALGEQPAGCAAACR